MLMNLDIGLLSLGDLITDPTTGERRTAAQRHRNLVEQAVLAESIGMTRVHLGEHHLCEYILSSPAVVLAAIAERTSTLRLSTGVALGANNSPIRLAEDYATLDVLSDGRAEPCLGRGTFFPHVFRAFGQDPTNAKAVFAEHVELICALLEHEDVHWSGAHHPEQTAVTLHPRPVQRPRPPVWLGAGASMDSVDLAARLGLWLMLPTVFGTIDMFEPVADRYRAAWASAGHAGAPRVGCCNHLWVAPTSQAARRQWEPRYGAYINWVNELQGRSAGRPAGTVGGLGQFDFDALTSQTAICGSPAEVIDRSAAIAEQLGLDTQIVMMDMGGVPDAELFAAMELLGAEVLPAFAQNAPMASHAVTTA
jgi:alkanesulfonate monooxygenase SsuD/methylene tetrahydromethanopterin reductase-like flavin-dependent oxidoreductase (luciferase family)